MGKPTGFIEYLFPLPPTGHPASVTLRFTPGCSASLHDAISALRLPVFAPEDAELGTNTGPAAEGNSALRALAPIPLA